MRRRLAVLLLSVACLPCFGEENERPRVRELGIEPGILEPGPLNAITDVAGVKVGHRTLIEGEGIRTGVTAIVPHDGNVFQTKVPAAVSRRMPLARPPAFSRCRSWETWKHRSC